MYLQSIQLSVCFMGTVSADVFIGIYNYAEMDRNHAGPNLVRRCACFFFFFVFIIIMSRDENLMHITTVLCLIRDERKDLQEV